MDANEIWKNFPVKRGRFNGKPKAHWEQRAQKLVVELLIRASECDERSVIGALAAERLRELAQAESAELHKEVCEERDRCRAGFQKFLAEVLP